jgi:hypothetical protein
MQINFQQAVNLVKTCGHNVTFLFQGSPGQAKSSILSALASHMPDYLPCYIDMANIDLGDCAMPVVDRDRMVTNYAPNARFGIYPGQTRPVIIMLDELGKAARPIMNLMLPLILERRLGDVALPPGSIVFATTNLATDGVGDNIPSHAMNRMTVLDYANIDCDSWLVWAAANDVAPEVMAFAKQYPQCFDRYDQADHDNGYIFNPLRGQTKAFTSPRSLAKASHLIAARDVLGEALLPALTGTIGESAARDLDAMVRLGDSIPSFESIIRSPETAKLPEGVGASFLMAYMCAGRVKEDTMDAVMTYVGRWTSFESVALFISTIAANATKVRFAIKNRAFTQQAAKLGKYF